MIHWPWYCFVPFNEKLKVKIRVLTRMTNTDKHKRNRDEDFAGKSNFAFAALVWLAPVFLLLLNGCYYDVEETLYPAELNPCDTTNVTYSGTIQPILQQNCYSCHSDAANLGSVSVEGYDNVLALVNDGRLVGSINYQAGFSPMPSDAPKLSDCNLLKIDTWISHGALNN